MQTEQKNSLHHPPSLKVFFATEMWERYGFYVVQSLLALYLALHFKWLDKRVYALVGSFTALTYLSPVIGGWIADHLLGQKRTILAGATFLFFSYLSLTSITSDLGLSAALAGIAVGTGLLKPNISSLLGNEYPMGSAKRESGFTIFYMGITTGIILGTTLPSILNEHFGWSVSFLSAAFGMIIAFFVFSFGAYHYKIADYHPYEFQLSKFVKTFVLLFILWLSSFYILNYPIFANSAFSAVVFLSLTYLIYTIKREPPEQARQTLVIGLLCIISVMFWAFYFQMFMSLTLFISRVVEPKLFGINFPPPYYVGIQSFGMIIFGYLLSRKKQELTLSQSGIRTGNKFLLAMIFMTLAYLLITLVSNGSENSDNLLSPLHFIAPYLMISIAELLLSPVGLSAITVLASRKKVSTMMGIFFVSLGIGGFLSGKLAGLTAVKAGELSIIELKAHYSQTFSTLLYILMVATIICAVLNYFIKGLLLKSARRASSS
ncbi:Dipeptide and tripeptide permease A [Legionella massiliensis]|uniref:Dipeptide and tripeptide permease A n=1 Tax=Legionella massiliensis TaxID=1034943 RepID=A0A078L1Y2_9GAMM|nr:oligopeptide:H+ symporter [Legionella massiliensis]CDZ79252.1 Dipeptide and tripeptide permease A [Legionella massiliensis]CEE14990.1 Dipeptide and tripeptide permease A [Legionella massiliensis]